MQLRIRARSTDVIDLRNRNRLHLPVRLHRDALQILRARCTGPQHRRARARLALVQHREQLPARAIESLERQRSPRATERLLEALVVERLHEIVHGRDVERLQRIPIEGRHEDRHRHLLGADRLHDIQPAFLRHLHIEKDEIGPQLANRLHRCVAIRGLADHLDAILTAQQVVHAKTAECFVVDDQHADGRQSR